MIRMGRLILAVAVSLMSASGAAFAQGALSYVSPFASQGKSYQVHVFGSSLADGLYYGLSEQMAKDPEIKLTNKARGGTSLLRGRFDWVGELERQVARSQPDIAVLMFGIGDRGVFFPTRGTDTIDDLAGKTADYVAKIDAMFSLLKKKGIATYVAGNPIMRGPKTRRAMRTINDIIRQRAFRYGFKYIDNWAAFAGDNGEYVSHGPDLEGRVRRLRADDGVYFTGTGYRKLAYPLVKEIQRDIKVAKADRKVPLAGDETEQNRVRPRPEQSKTASADGKARGAGDDDANKNEKARNARVKRSPRLSLNALEKKSDHSEILLRTRLPDGTTNAVKIQIYRPAIPAAVISHVIRRSRRVPDNKIGDQVRGDVGGNLTALSTIAPVNAIGASGKLQGPITQSPYYKVLVKGERLEPKRGRADDFRWKPKSADPKPAS